MKKEGEGMKKKEKEGERKTKEEGGGRRQDIYVSV